MEPKIALITGGTSGIGKEIVFKFIKEGYCTLFTYWQNEEKANKIKEKIQKQGGKCEAYHLDIRKEKQIQELVQKIINTYGKIDILVNNAAIDKASFIEEKKKEDFVNILDINLIGPFFLARDIAKHMQKQKEGKIINISSNNSINTNCPYTLEYDASKAALNSLTTNLADFYAPYIQVNAIAPGWVETENLDLEKEEKDIELEKISAKRFAHPKEIAALAYFLTTEEASYINREIIKIDGGFHG